MNYFSHLFIFFCIYLIISLGSNLTIGKLGLFSLAQAAFVAIGGYTFAIITTVYQVNPLLALLVSAMVGIVASFSVSIPSLRFKSDYFLIISLAVQSLVFGLIHNWFSSDSTYGTLRNLTNGPNGISGIPQINIFLNLDPFGELSLIYGLIASLILFFCSRVMKGSWSKILECIRDDELIIKGLGKNIQLIKIIAFGISGFCLALAGAMYASYVGYIDSSTARLDESILWLSMILIGGLGTIRGSIFGSIFFLLLPEGLRFIPFPSNIASDIRLLIFGLLILIVIHLRPKGVMGNYDFNG